MEETLTLDELFVLLNTHREKEFEHRKFLAAMQGVDLGGDTDERFEAVKRQAEAELAGKDPQQYALSDLIAFEDDD